MDSRIALSLSSSVLALLMGLAGWNCGGPEPEARILSVVSTSAGHVHTADIRYRALRSGLRRFYLETSEGHRHSFDVTAEGFGLLELGYPFVAESSTDQFHTHQVTLQKQSGI